MLSIAVTINKREVCKLKLIFSIFLFYFYIKMHRRSRTPIRHNPYQTPPRPTTAAARSTTPGDVDPDSSPAAFRMGGYELISSPFFDDHFPSVSSSTHDQFSILPDVPPPETAQERLRNIRQDALSYHLPGTACFIGEKLMVTTGKRLVSIKDICLYVKIFHRFTE